MTRQQVLETLSSMGLAPNKRYGQNFLVDTATAKRIVEAADCQGCDVLEIGPGLGSLTEHLVQTASSLSAVEIDSGFCRFLAQKFDGSIKLIHGDFLKIDIPPVDCVVANLPYYCSSEIIFAIAQKTVIEKALVMVQREMAQRLIAKSGTGAYGASAAALWLDMRVEMLFDVSPGAFYPPPEIVSSILLLTRVKRDISDVMRQTYHQLVRAGFWARRKQFYACITTSPFFRIEKQRAAALLEFLQKPHTVRAEELSPEEFLRASRFICGDQ